MHTTTKKDTPLTHPHTQKTLEYALSTRGPWLLRSMPAVQLHSKPRCVVCRRRFRGSRRPLHLHRRATPCPISFDEVQVIQSDFEIEHFLLPKKIQQVRGLQLQYNVRNPILCFAFECSIRIPHVIESLDVNNKIRWVTKSDRESQQKGRLNYRSADISIFRNVYHPSPSVCLDVRNSAVQD